MMLLFDYIFYRAYKLGKDKTNAPMAYAAGIVSVSQFFALFTLFMMAKFFFGLSGYPSKLIALLVIVILLGVNWYRYERNPELDKMQRRWGGEEEREKIIKGWLIVFLIAFLVITPLYAAKKDYESKHPAYKKKMTKKAVYSKSW